ncbi:MAG: OmpH family outer membrane protein [Salibacteraceae bacterium]
MKKFLLAIAIVLGVSMTSVAQSPKIGHINSQELMQLMPEAATIRTELEKEAASLETQMTAMQTEYQNLVRDYQANEAAWSDLIRDSKVKEINDLEGRLQTFQQNAQQSLTAKEQALIEPVIKKAQDAIDAVAKANGYTYVFDTSVGAVLVYPEGDNMLALVKKHLGIL